MNQSFNFDELFLGFQNTPLLWSKASVLDIEQYSPKSTQENFSKNPEIKRLRLGKWVEHFVSHQLNNNSRIRVLEENIQIKNDKITIGELDVLFLEDDTPIHLEIIYKFYLYDDSIDSKNPLDKWIGPNRNDALVYKLKKLKEKQLPLLYLEHTQQVLQKHQIQPKAIKQSVCFKAQLFLPFNSSKIDLSPLNNACVSGWFISYSRINEIENYQFYIPEKLDWLTIPNLSVEFQSFKNAEPRINEFVNHKQSPLCWIKSKNNTILKCFITWW